MSIVIDVVPVRERNRKPNTWRDKLAVGLGKTYTGLSDLMAEKSNCDNGDYLMILGSRNGSGKIGRLFFRIVKPQYADKECAEIANITGASPALAVLHRGKKGRKSFRAETKFIYNLMGIEIENMEWLTVTIDTDRRLPEKIFYVTGDVSQYSKKNNVKLVS